VFERFPTLKNRDLAQLLPHNWHAPAAGTATVTTVTVPAAAVAQGPRHGALVGTRMSFAKRLRSSCVHHLTL
jgi:hypothetical protein